MAARDPCVAPSNSSIFEGGEPARTVAVKKSVNGFSSGAGAVLFADQPLEVVEFKEALQESTRGN